MTLGSLRAEYERDSIGPEIYGEIVRIVRGVVSRYDPQVYAGVPNWSHGVDDLVQEVIVDRLLEEGQLAYAFTVAFDLHHWQALIGGQVRRALAHRRRRSVIDNLLERADGILSSEPFWSSSGARGPQYQLRGGPTRPGPPNDAELREAALAIAAIPVTIGHGAERAPMVYSTAALETVLDAIARALPCSFVKNDLDRILRSALTPWLAGDLVGIEGALELPSDDLKPEWITEVHDIALTIVRRLTAEGRHILRLKLVGLSDHDIAERVGLSRPTVAHRKQGVLAVLREELTDASHEVREAVLAELGLLLTQSGGRES